MDWFCLFYFNIDIFYFTVYGITSNYRYQLYSFCSCTYVNVVTVHNVISTYINARNLHFHYYGSKI